MTKPSCLKKAIELEPDRFIDHDCLGDMYSDLRLYNEAIGEYQVVIDNHSEDARPHNGLGNVYAAMGRNGDALAAFRRARDLDPKDAMSHNGLGKLYADMGRAEES